MKDEGYVQKMHLQYKTSDISETKQYRAKVTTKHNFKLETVSIAEPLQNRQHAQMRKTPNAVNSRQGGRDRPIRMQEGNERGRGREGRDG